MKRALLVSLLVFASTSPIVARDGLVGITISRDFSVVREVASHSPAARAGVRVGDRLIAVNGYPVAKLQDAADFQRKVAGPPGSEVELELQSQDHEQSVRIRLRRAPAPTPRPSQVPPGF